jgi:hypothetical protein
MDPRCNKKPVQEVSKNPHRNRFVRFEDSSPHHLVHSFHHTDRRCSARLLATYPFPMDLRSTPFLCVLYTHNVIIRITRSINLLLGALYAGVSTPSRAPTRCNQLQPWLCPTIAKMLVSLHTCSIPECAIALLVQRLQRRIRSLLTRSEKPLRSSDPSHIGA